MPALDLRRCLGLDTRPSWDGDDTFKLDIGTNIEVLPGGSVRNRPALVKHVDVHAQSKGLYARGNYLRCVVPSGQSYQDSAPAGIIYDGIGQGGSFSYVDKISKVTGAETFGTSKIYGPHGYVGILRSDTNLLEQHWIKEPPASAATYTDTKENLPFQPGPALTKIANKIVASDPANGYFRYCSTLNGPDDFITAGDAGFEAALQYVSGARDLVGFGIHRGLLAVAYGDAMQLWKMDEVPANIELLQVLSGPGTDFPGSMANVLGDLFFLSRSGFANLATATVTGEARYGDIGDRIASLTALIDSTANPISLWSQKRSEYLCAVGATVYCFSRYPLAKQDAWTTWTLPTTVEALVEHQGTLYVRSGNTVYRFDDTQDTDYNGVKVASTMQLGPMSFRTGLNKALRHLTVQSTGKTTWTPIVDGRTLTSCATSFPGALSPTRATFLGSGRRIGLSMTASGSFRLDGIRIEAELAGV